MTSPVQEAETPAREASGQRGADAAIFCDALTKTYGADIKAVDELELTVHPGEIFGLLGPNGAGKTTTVGMLTTMIVPTSGTARVGGVDVVADPAGARGAIGVVSQHNTLDRAVSARDNLYFHARYFGMSRREARSQADRWLQTFKLDHRAKAQVGTLSGGMARRLMLARALLHEPPVLFLDEPTAGLDPQSRLGLWDIIEEMHAAGQTVLLTTHYIEEADKFCDRVAIMDHGKILALDTPAKLKGELVSGATVALGGDGNRGRLEMALSKIDGVAILAGRVDHEAPKLRVSSVDGTLAKVIAAAEKCGFRIRDVSMVERSLESVFIEMTGRGLRD